MKVTVPVGATVLADDTVAVRVTGWLTLANAVLRASVVLVACCCAFAGRHAITRPKTSSIQRCILILNNETVRCVITYLVIWLGISRSFGETKIFIECMGLWAAHCW